MLQIRDLGFEIRHEEWLRQTLSCSSLYLRCFWSLACPCRRHLKSPFHRLWLLLFLLDWYLRETLAVADRGAASMAAILFPCGACRAPRVASVQRAFRGCSLWLCRAWSDQHRSIANQSFGRPWVLNQAAHRCVRWPRWCPECHYLTSQQLNTHSTANWRHTLVNWRFQMKTTIR